MTTSWERGRPARTGPAQLRLSLPLRSTGNGTVPGLLCKGCSRFVPPITPPLRGSRRSRAARRRLMRWGVKAGPPGCSAGSTGPRAHASAAMRTPPSRLNVTSAEFLQNLPAGDILPRLRRSKRKACRTSFLGRPGLTAASPLSPKPQHCRETGLLKDNPRAPARGSSGAANAAAALSRGRKPMETATPPSRVGGDSNPPWCSIANKPGRAQRSLYPECSPKKSLDVRQMNSIW